MRRFIASVSALAVVVALSMSVPAAAANDSTFHGVITDDVCGKKHPVGDSANVISCVEKGARFALYDAKSDKLFVLSDQAKAKEFAAAHVLVKGTLSEDGKTITVTSISKDEGKHGA